MSILPATAIATLRRVVERGMTARGDVLRAPTATVDQYNRPVPSSENWVMVVGMVDLPCSFSMTASPVEAVINDVRQVVTGYTVKFPHGTPAEAHHRLVVRHSEPGVPSPLAFTVIGPAYKLDEITRTLVCTLAGAA